MDIVVNRFVSDTDSTISHVSVDGQTVCFGLEDEFRSVKVKGETRIPEGAYKVKLRTEGGKHARYRKRFADFHRGMLHVQDVPGFEFILIHCGNTQRDTEGCLLVGANASTKEGQMSISASEAAYRRLYPMVVDAAAAGALRIQYIDNDL